MLLGQTRSGKSVTCQIAAQSKGNTEGITIHRHFINPKSMTMDQLYGYYDSKNCEWRDGVLSSVMRECSKDNSQNHHWIVLDGPVDACWI